MTEQRTITRWATPARRPLAAVLLAGLAVTGLGSVGASAADSSAPEGTIATAAGRGSGSTSYGFSGDGGMANAAQLYQPRAVTFDADGNTFIADALNQRIRRITPAGTISTVAGNGIEGFAGDGGSALDASLNQPHGVAVDSRGNLYIADSGNNRIRRVSPAGTITTIAGDGTPAAGGDGGPAKDAFLKQPKTLALRGDDLYIADAGNNRIRKIDLDSGDITSVAGVTAAGFTGDGGPAQKARLNSPAGVAVTSSGTVYIADTDNHRVRRIGSSGDITTVAGTGTAGFSGDGGRAKDAQLNDPRAVAVDGEGNLYIGEELGQRVRRVSPSGTITTIVGTGVGGYAGDGGPATQAQIDRLRAITIDSAGHLWIADTFNNRVRVVFAVTSPSGSGTAPWAPPATPPPAPPAPAPPVPVTVTTTPSNPAAPTPRRSGYWMLGSDGRIYPFGDARSLGDPSGTLGGAEAVQVVPTATYAGYWILDSRGRISTHGDAIGLGTVPAGALGAGENVTSLSATPSGKGYWLFTSKGRVFRFGDAGFHGDMTGVALNGPVLSSVATPSGKGYYMVASDGGVFSFGDATFRGSMGHTRLNKPVQSLVPNSAGTGYWLVASDGGIFAFGDAPFRGSMGSVPLNKPVVGMVRFGNGYLMVAADGGIFNFSDRPFSGSLGGNPPARPIVAVATLDAP